MKINRRNFLKLSGASLAGATIPLSVKQAETRELLIKDAVRTTSICPFCAVGCGLWVWARNGTVVHIEGDAEHPINEGALCSKGMALTQLANSDRRITRPLYRRPGGTGWEEKPWDWTLSRIATLIKKTRNATFRSHDNGITVNRTEGIAALGGAAMDNEECYLYVKLARALGLVYIEHQARI